MGSTCADYEGYSSVRFCTIVSLSSVALIGSVLNLLLLLGVLLPDRRLTLSVLAILDTLLCSLYLLLFGMDAINVYLHTQVSFEVWRHYALWAFVLSRTIQLAMPYVLLYATAERLIFLSATRNRFLQWLVSRSVRLPLTGSLILGSVLLKMPMLWAFRMSYFPNCTIAHRTAQIDSTQLFFNLYYTIYDSQVMAVLQILLPFALFLAINTFSIRRLWRRQASLQAENGQLVDAEQKTDVIAMYSAKKGQSQTALHLLNSSGRKVAHRISLQLDRDKRRIINSLQCLTIVGVAYLICNSLHLSLSIMERAQWPLLRDADDMSKSSDLHIILSDTVSALYMLCSAVRPLVYYKFNDEIKIKINQLCCCNDTTFQEQRTPLLKQKSETLI